MTKLVTTSASKVLIEYKYTSDTSDESYFSPLPRAQIEYTRVESYHEISVKSPQVQIYLRPVLFLSSPESSNRIYPSQVLSLIHDDDEDAHKDTYDDPVVDDGEDAHKDAQVNPSQDLMPTFGFLRF